MGKKPEKIHLELTKHQLNRIIDIVDYTSAKIGGGDEDEKLLKCIESFDNMLLSNGYKRKYK